MSEIYEALRKAQREADARQRPGGDTARQPPLRLAVPAAAPAPGAEEPGAPQPAPHPVRRGLRGWLRALLRRAAEADAPDGLLAERLRARRGTPMGEQFRVLRSRIETAGFGTYMITSALEREGKTLCATNLAFALADSLGAAGVILVDADLRRPSVGAWFGLRGGPGLADCLLGDAHWSTCLHETGHPALRVLPAGRESSRSTELLGSERMAVVLDEMKEAHPQHYVVVDAPPLLLTADPLVLARHVDRVLLVVRAGITPRAAVAKAIDILGSERFLGIVLNGTTETFTERYQYGYGRYGYYGTSPSAG